MIPVNEMGVIVLFAQQNRFEIASIQMAFPDAVIVIEGVEYSVEFEFLASNFKAHRHDIRICDIVVCWENDWPDCILPVIELSDPDWQDMGLSLALDTDKEIAYWKLRALRAERMLHRHNAGVENDDEEFADWMPEPPRSKAEFVAMVQEGLIVLPDDLTGKTLAALVPALNTPRSARLWIEATKPVPNDNGHH